MRNSENRFDVLFWGDRALFTNPLTALTGSKYSYAVPTKSAIKGMMKSVYWKPSIEWEIDSIEILKPIRRETQNVLLQADQYRSSQRGTNSYLTDVAYRVKAHLQPSSYKCFSHDQQHGLQKHSTIAHSRFERGHGYKTPVLGVSECMSFTCETSDNPEMIEHPFYHGKDIPLDMMLLDIVYPTSKDDPIYRIFWIPEIKDGIIEFPSDLLVSQCIENDELALQNGLVVEQVSPEQYHIDRAAWQDEEDADV